MTKPKSKYPISSFGPELMAFLIRSGRERVVLTFEGERGKASAHTFQRRVHTLRQQMRQENHSDYQFAARARVAIVWGEKAVAEGAPQEWKDDHRGHRGALIIGRPHDSEFAGILRDAGVSVPGAAPLPPNPTPSVTPPPEGVPSLDMLSEILDMVPGPGGKK